jgi:hypothetical protein
VNDAPGAWQAPLSPGEPRSFGGGRFVVQRRLGAGNFATVYLAHDERLDVLVAVKLLSDRWSWEPEVRGRFVQEARLLRSLNDAHVVQIRDIAETDDGRPYLVMDFATEGTLEQRSLEMAQRGVRPTSDDLRVVARALATALGVLHERRIAHRDIKPSNLLITRTGAQSLPPPRAATDTSILRPGERLMLGDLGLAKDLAFDSGVTVGVGTAGYMAPEQSLPGAKIDMRTDIYAASALLAQLASGEPPDPVRRVSNGRLETGRPFSPNIPPPLGAALLRGLDTDPAGRQPSIEQWLYDVEAGLGPAVGQGQFVPVTAAGVGRPPSTLGGRRRIAIAATAALVLAGGIGLAVYSGKDEAGTTTSESTPAEFRVTLSGPTSVTLGEQAIWTVEAPGAVSGTWSLTGPVQPDPADWNPGNWFEGTWNQPGTITLTLTAVDADGNTDSDSITFVVG